MCNSDIQTTNTSLSSVDNELENIVTAECFDNNIEDRLCAPINQIDLSEIPISALQSESRNILSNLLNSQKVLLENGICRDWRGVLQCALSRSNFFDISSKQDQMKEVLNIWYKEDKENATLGRLQHILQTIDRWDVLQDTNNFAEDSNVYLRMKLNMNNIPSNINASNEYDALVLFADEDSDFATQIIIELERRGLKTFQKDRDLLVGEHENEALRQHISRCCRHLIVIFSNDFFNSPVNRFLTNFALWKGVTETKRVVVPCVIKPCNIPDPWDSYRKLEYYKQSPLYNFWDKLLQSVSKQSDILLPETNEIATIKDTILELEKSSASVKPTPKLLTDVPLKQENETVSLINSSSIDQLLSKLPEIVSDEPCSSTKTKESDKKKWKRFLKFRKRGKDRTAANDY